VNYTITNIDEVGNEVHFTFTATGTNSGKFLGLAPTQKKVQWEGRAVATVVNGKIDTLHVIEDELSKASKLGLGNQISTVTGIGPQPHWE
jgi:predicted ester cyclase